jgi:hypothetical protein
VLPGQGAYWDPTFLVAGGKRTSESHCTDITTDLGVEWLETRPQDKPFFLMLHHKAPQRNWAPATRHIEMFKERVILKPDTPWDDYATRPAALLEDEQTVAHEKARVLFPRRDTVAQSDRRMFVADDDPPLPCFCCLDVSFGGGR